VILTLDIGGANTKHLLMDESGRVLESSSAYLPLWKGLRALEEHLALLGSRHSPDAVAVTMTGELCDIFSSRAEGVERISGAVLQAFPEARFLTLDMELVSVPDASCAGANYLASIYLMERRFGEGVLLDIGSTTSDVLPFRRGEKLHRHGDLARLMAGQLVYTGFLRTPLCAISEKVPLRGFMLRQAAEVFAVAADLYLVLGELGQEAYTCATPDGREKSREAALRRIARQVCAEVGEVGEEELEELCRYLAERQASAVAEAVRRVCDAHALETLYLGGCGVPLGRRVALLAGMPWVELAEHLPASDNLPCLGLAAMLLEGR